MSHRRPATRADRYMDGLLKWHPELLNISDVIDTFSPKCMSLWTRMQNPLSMSHTEIAQRANTDRSFLLMEDIALWSRWRTCRHVYHFDRALSTELMESAMPDSMPTEALRRLPYPCIYVDAPFETTGRSFGSADDSCRVIGYFAWTDTAIAKAATTLGDSIDALMLMLLYEDERPRTVMTVSLDQPTLGQVVENMVAADMYEINHLRNIGTRVDVSGDYESVTRQRLCAMLSHLLYIIADNSDQEIVYKPSSNTITSRKRRAQSTIHEVGARVGRSLGDTKFRYVSKPKLRSSGASERTVRAHVRSGHWHHYWTGPRANPLKRQLTVHWLMPTVVNAYNSDEAETVIHDAKK